MVRKAHNWILMVALTLMATHLTWLVPVWVPLRLRLTVLPALVTVPAARQASRDRVDLHASATADSSESLLAPTLMMSGGTSHAADPALAVDASASGLDLPCSQEMDAWAAAFDDAATSAIQEMHCEATVQVPPPPASIETAETQLWDEADTGDDNNDTVYANAVDSAGAVDSVGGLAPMDNDSIDGSSIDGLSDLDDEPTDVDQGDVLATGVGDCSPAASPPPRAAPEATPPPARTATTTSA